MLVVKKKKCVGCGQCVPFCPEGALQVWVVAAVERGICTECQVCVDYCPVDALEITHKAGEV